MSLFRPEIVPCPNCGAPNKTDSFYSINADRRPDLRDAVLDRTLQKATCPNCQAEFRVDPDFNYLDSMRGQWIAVHPLRNQQFWADILPPDQAAFDRSYGPEASEGAQAIGDELTVRITFGWAAFREKLVAAQAGLDDRELELLKIAILREEASPRMERTSELRLVDVVDGDLVLAWLNATSDRVLETLVVPMKAYDTIAADSEGWAPLRAEIDANPYVDMNRLIS